MRRSWLRLFWAGVIVLAAGIAYLVSTGYGERLLHDEIERQMSRLLEGHVEIAEVDLHFRNGLWVEAHDVEAYPSRDEQGPPALRANRIQAWVDFVALLVGRLELSKLVLEGPHLRLEQDADGTFPDLPLPQRIPPPDAPGPPSLVEGIASRITALDPAAAEFVDGFRLADRIEIVDGTLNWIDHRALDADGAPRELRLELVSGVAKRDWLSEAIEVKARAVFVDGRSSPFSVEIGIERDEGPDFDWSLDLTEVPLESVEGLLARFGSVKDLDGTLDAKLHLETSPGGARLLRVDASVADAAVLTAASKARLRQGDLELHALLDLDERRLRISEGRLSDRRLAVEFKSVIDRPLVTASRARIESRMVGVEIDDLPRLARRFPDDSDIAIVLTRLVERVTSGSIRSIEVAGTERIHGWGDLIAGRVRSLPEGFVLSGAFEDVEVNTGLDVALEDLAADIEWARDQITVRDMTAIYAGRPLPRLNAVLQGVSHLYRASESVQAMSPNYEAVPGVVPLVEIFKPRDPNALPPVKAVALAIDRLDHPILRWPLRDVRVLVEPLRGGVEVNIREGTWSGAAISGDLIWSTDGDASHVDAQVVIGPPPAPPPPDDPEIMAQRWGEGRFELQFRPSPRLPFRRGTGFFRLEGASLVGNEIEIALDPKGTAALRTKIDLSDPDAIGLDLSFAITEATMEGMSQFVVLPPDLVTGAAGATGSLTGPVRPNTSFVAELDGRVRVELQAGRLEMKLPLMLRLGKASEGYNPFANSDELEYESLKTTIELEHGLLRTEDFEIEGPLRVFANAALDTNKGPPDIRAVVGIFLFRTSSEILGTMPLVRSLLPGSDRGLIGAYFEVDGPVQEPRVEALPMKTLMSSVPSAIQAPFKVLSLLFRRTDGGS